MQVMTASDAKNKFGQLLDTAQTGPVRVQRQGRDVAVVLSPSEYERLTSKANGLRVNPLVEQLHSETMNEFDEVFKALAK
jgi:prevent-host-death family protein